MTRRNQRNNTNHKLALTLLETAVTVTLAALTLAAMATTLQAAKNQSRSDVCLTNLKALGNAIYTYAAEYNNILPGPAYPGLSHHQTLRDYQDHGYTTEYAEYEINRRLTTLLKNVLGNTQTDQQITCPTMAAIVPDQLFQEYEYRTGRWIWPTHYTLNNVSNYEIDVGGASGATGGRRETNPANYFGLSPYIGATYTPSQPRSLTLLKNASTEWMIADAWYRPRTNAAAPFLQQEGPFQWQYSGLPLPPFAPHLRRAGQNYNYTSNTSRSSEARRVRAQRSDGLTNTLFFDGHAAPVPSRTATINGYQILYGFPGTVNPWFSNNPNQAEAYERLWNMIIWE